MQVKGSPFAAGSYPWGVTVIRTDKFVLSGPNYTSDNVSVYHINPRWCFDAGAGVAVCSGFRLFRSGDRFGGPFLYAVNEHSGNVSAYQINLNSGVLTQVRGSPFAAGVDPYGVAIDPSDKLAYVANADWGSGASSISAYAIKEVVP